MTGRVSIITADALRSHIKAGLTTAEIAARFGVQPPAVTRACHRFGLSLPAGVTGRKKDWEPSREDDERDLGWLGMAARGISPAQIGDRCGYASGSSIYQRIKAIEKADLAESGEPAREVAKGYPLFRGLGA